MAPRAPEVGVDQEHAGAGIREGRGEVQAGERLPLPHSGARQEDHPGRSAGCGEEHRRPHTAERLGHHRAGLVQDDQVLGTAAALGTPGSVSVAVSLPVAPGRTNDERLASGAPPREGEVRDGGERRQLEQVRHVLAALHAVVEVLAREGRAEPEHEPRDQAEGQVQGHVRLGRVLRHLGTLDDADVRGRELRVDGRVHLLLQ